MARIAGVNIPTGKRVPIALTSIFGIGGASARAICDSIGIDQSRRMNELSDGELLALREHIDSNFVVEGDLRREVQINIKTMMDLGSYRGLRHRRGATGARSAHTYECPYPEGSREADRRQEKIAGGRKWHARNSAPNAENEKTSQRASRTLLPHSTTRKF